MAITAQALSPLPSGAPSISGSGSYVWGPGDVQEPAIVGTVTFTGDGATLAGVVNFVDGTIAIPFTPTQVLVFLAGGTDTTGVLRAEGSSASLRVSGLTNTSFTVNYSTAIANTSTSKLLILVYR